MLQKQLWPQCGTPQGRLPEATTRPESRFRVGAVDGPRHTCGSPPSDTCRVHHAGPDQDPMLLMGQRLTSIVHVAAPRRDDNSLL